MGGYAEQRRWSDGKIDEIKSILRQFAPLMADFRFDDANYEQDTKECTDGFMCLVSRNERIALRVRKEVSTGSQVRYRDLTIRARSSNGGLTEIDKIRERYVRYYFYAWTDENERITEWMLVDIHKMLDARLLDGLTPKVNKDGRTSFVSISGQRLNANGCVIAHTVRGMTGAIQTEEQKQAHVLEQFARLASGLVGVPVDIRPVNGRGGAA